MDQPTLVFWFICLCIGGSYAQILPCIPILDNDTVSPACMEDYNTACEARYNLDPWAVVMFDSNGREESGKFYGDLIYLGDYKQCVQWPKQQKSMEINPIQEELHFCVAFWEDLMGHGLCLPGSCSSEDFLTILKREYTLARPTLINATFNGYYCVEEKNISSDAAAIISIVILCMFGVTVIAATLYDKISSSGHSPKVSDKQMGMTVMETGDSKVCVPCGNGANEKDSVEPPAHNGKIVESQLADVQNHVLHSPTANGRYSETVISNGIISNGEHLANGISNGHVNSAYEVRRDEHGAHSQIKGDEVQCSADTSYPKMFHGITDADTSPHLHAKSRYDVYESSPHVSHQQFKRNKGTRVVAADLLLAFSLFKNFLKLMSAKPPKVNYGCVNGLRFLSMVGVILGHTYFVSAFVSENLLELFFMERTFTFETINQMTLAVDTFFILSGFLVTMALLHVLRPPSGQHSKGFLTRHYLKKMALYYFHRYWRLTPVYAIVLMVYTNLFNYFITSPVYPARGLQDIANCKQYWWGNLLYINNFFPAEKQCFSLAWYLANDMQFYVILPIFVAPLVYAEYLRGKQDRYTNVALVLSLIWVGLAICGSLISRIYLYYEYSTGNPDIDYNADIYTVPWTRSAVYFMAVYLGYFTYRTKGEVTIHPVVVGLGWLVAMACIGMSFYLPYLTSPNCASSACGAWTVAGNTAFSALQRPMFALGIIWIIFACLSGYGGIVNSILSWKFWNPLSRLTYVGYLLHMMVQALYVYSSTVQLHISHWTMIYFFAGSLLLTMCLSIIVTLVFEAPMMGIEKVLLPQRKPKN